MGSKNILHTDFQPMILPLLPQQIFCKSSPVQAQVFGLIIRSLTPDLPLLTDRIITSDCASIIKLSSTEMSNVGEVVTLPLSFDALPPTTSTPASHTKFQGIHCR